MNREMLSHENIQLVVQLALSALSRCDLKACVIGGVAAQMHGVEYRETRDVDLLVLNAGVDQDAEEIKRKLIEMDSSHLSLTPSRVAGATHRILWCTLDDTSVMSNGRSIPVRTPATRTCKIDILTPDQLYMPYIPEPQLYEDPENTFMAYFSDLESPSPIPISYPTLSTLLMLKLRAWVDHSLPSANEVKHGKIPQDENDIQEILRLGMPDGKLAGTTRRGLTQDEMWTLGGFASWKEVEQSVEKFMKKWPQTANSWRVGFA